MEPTVIKELDLTRSGGDGQTNLRVKFPAEKVLLKDPWREVDLSNDEGGLGTSGVA